MINPLIFFIIFSVFCLAIALILIFKGWKTKALNHYESTRDIIVKKQIKIKKPEPDEEPDEETDGNSDYVNSIGQILGMVGGLIMTLITILVIGNTAINDIKSATSPIPFSKELLLALDFFPAVFAIIAIIAIAIVGYSILNSNSGT